jgi:hypothetical protein
MRRVVRISITAAALTLLLCGLASARGHVPAKLGSAAAALVPPANDSQAPLLPMNGSRSGTNVEATEDAEEPLTWRDADGYGCLENGDWGTAGWPMRNTVWYWVEGTGRTISTYAAGADVDTILAVYAADGTFMGCSDDVFDDDDYRWSALRFPSRAGTDYFLQVGSACVNRVWGGTTRCGGTRGEGTIFVGAATQPGDDNRAAATPITLGEQTTRSLLGATEEAGEKLDCDGSPFGKTRWFRVNVPSAGTLTVSATSAGHDSVVGVYAAGSATRLACNDDTAGTSSSAQVSAAVSAGAYDIQLGGYGPGLLADDLEPTVLSTGFAPTPPPPVNRDQDGDGVNGDGGDCDDSNAGVRPGAAEIPNNGVDENCDGKLALDADGDGHVSVATGGDDCDDTNRAISPGARELPGNKLDDDCRGGDEKPRRVTSNPVIRWRFYRESSSIEVVRVEVTSLAAGTQAKLVCAGRGCPKRKTQTKNVKRATQKLRFDLRFNKRLRRSSKLTLTVTRPGYIGVVRVIKVGRRQVDDRTLCLWPDARTAKRCPTDD